MKKLRFARSSHLGIAICLGIFLWLVSSFIFPLHLKAANPQVELFEEVWETVNDNFYDPAFNGTNWEAMKDKYMPQVERAKSTEESATLINQMLSELQTSHTHLYTQNEPAYYQLLGIFQGFTELQEAVKKTLPDGKLEYSGIGMFTEEMEGKTFVKAILEDSPAAKEGLKIGDRLLSVDGAPYEPIKSFAGQEGQEVELAIQRSENPDSQETIAIAPQAIDPTTMFLAAQQASTKILEIDGKKIGYTHIWTRVGDDRDLRQLETDLIYDRLKDADGLILDLRDGWGGINLSYLHLFTGKSPTLIQTGRDGKAYELNYVWKKPVVALVNEGTRSAKEIVAFGFQQYGIGSVIGSQTAGAVVAGRPFPMADGSLLYVAVADVAIEGERLEGKGVVPDIEVPVSLPYAGGSDPQKEKAIERLLTLL